MGVNKTFYNSALHDVQIPPQYDPRSLTLTEILREKTLSRPRDFNPWPISEGFIFLTGIFISQTHSFCHNK